MGGICVQQHSRLEQVPQVQILDSSITHQVLQGVGLEALLFTVGAHNW
jgi:hypothetical protein